MPCQVPQTVSVCTPMDAALIDMGESRKATLVALRDMTARLGRIPSLAELAKRRKLSVPGVKKHLDWLQKRRLVSRPPSIPRAVVLTAAGKRAASGEAASSVEELER